MKTRNDKSIPHCHAAIVLAVLLAALASFGCGTDGDNDDPSFPIDIEDTVGDSDQETSDDGADDVQDADGDEHDIDEEVEDVGDDIDDTVDDIEDVNAEDGTEDSQDVENDSDVDDVSDADESETSDVEDVSDAEDLQDIDGGVDGGGTVGTPCATHCRCADGLFCSNSAGTCQPIVIGGGFYCCSDYPSDCPEGQACDLDTPEGGEGVCGE
jgi:hypothetical protein